MLKKSLVSLLVLLLLFAAMPGCKEKEVKPPEITVTTGDAEIPVITLSGGDRESKAGKAVRLADAAVVSRTKEVRVFIFYQGTTGNLKEVPKIGEGEYKGKYGFCPAKKDTYLIRYLAIDEDDHEAIADYMLKVS